MKNILSAILVLFSISIASAQEGGLQSSRSTEQNLPIKLIDVPGEILSKVDLFFSQLKEKNVRQAYTDLLADSPIFRQKDEMGNLIDQTNKSFDIYGELKGHEPVNSEIVTPSYLRVRYIGLHTNYPVRWLFTFYKSPEKGWIVTNIKFDDLSEFFFSDQ
jgi:hypothetical protein